MQQTVWMFGVHFVAKNGIEMLPRTCNFLLPVSRPQIKFKIAIFGTTTTSSNQQLHLLIKL
jgi:hypothetical protein